MNDNNNPQATSRIVIEFAAPGSAEFNVQVHGATPAQVLAVGEYLRLMAARQFNDAWTHEAMVRAKQNQEMDTVSQMLKRH
jgi:hypothetical protein